jgi:pimeloyl-ACP methyl ester carboxylesterase
MDKHKNKKALEKSFYLIVKNRRMFAAIGTSSLVVSSGLLAWQMYQVQQQQDDMAEVGEQMSGEQRRRLVRELTREEYEKIQYVPVAQEFLSKLNMFDELKLHPMETKEDFKSIIPRHLKKNWRLLHTANEGEYEHHLKAVKELSRLKLYEAEYAQLAQSCQKRTAIGLARSNRVDLRWFMPPPPLPPTLEGRTIVSLFKEILTKLPTKSDKLNDCIIYYTTTALDDYLKRGDDEELLDSDISFEFHRESHHIHSIPRPQISQETLVEHCLQALLSHSTVEEQCTQLLTALPLFQMVLQAHPDNPRIKSLIGKILANISLYPQHHENLFRNGWVGRLAAWKQDPNLLVNLPATKALCNLDQEYGVHRYQPGVYLMLPTDRYVQHKNQLSNWGVDIVFVHGLLGGVFYTWRQQDKDNNREFSAKQISEDDYSYCWPRDWLQSESENVRVIGVDFDSFVSQWGGTCPTQSFNSSLDDRSAEILSRLQEAGVGTRPVIFVGHSMGGLIIKKMLTAADTAGDDKLTELANNTKGVIFYSTPHEGSHIAKLNSIVKYIFFPSVEVQELEFGSPALTDLNMFFKQFVQKFKTRVISFGETIPTRHLGLDLNFVPVESSNPGVGEFYPVPYNHMDICKPESRKSVLFRKLYSMVWDTLDEASPFDK